MFVKPLVRRTLSRWQPSCSFTPYGPPSTWRSVAELLRAQGHHVAMPPFAGLLAGPGPFWPALIEHAALDGAGLRSMLVVGHSGAGPALPAIAAAIIGTAGLIFVDATLPRPGFSRSAGVPPAERDSAEFEAALARGTLRNLWAREATWNLAGISGADAAPLARETPDIPVAMNGEVVPTPANWDAFPAGYLAFVANAFYAPELAGARSRHWPTLEVPGAHFHMLVDPAAVAAALVRLADGLRAMNLSPGSRQAP